MDWTDLPFDLVLYDTIQHGSGGLRNLNKECSPTWRRSKRSVGGYWLGTAYFAGDLADMQEMFLYGLGREIRESIGSTIGWQGFLVQADLTLGGITYSRRWTDLANRVQTIYTKLGDNLFTNGSVESGAWSPSFGSPDVSSGQSTAWVSDGTYSEFISNTSSNNGGKYIQQNITIVAATAYDITVAVNVVAGPWVLVVCQHGAGTDGSGHPAGVIATGSTSGTGQATLRASIPATNTYAGGVDVLVYNKDDHTGQIYCDMGSFRISPAQARTAWYADATSQAEYGTLELALLQGSMADAAANGHAQTALYQHRWPRTTAPDDYSPSTLQPSDSLFLTFAGYVWTLRNKYVIASRAGTTQSASTHVTNLVGDSEFIMAGSIQSNTMQYQIDNRAPLRVWEVLRDITLAGDAVGNRWNIGVRAGRVLDYLPASTTPDYHFKGGEILSNSFDAIMPWLVEPGLVYMDDVPVGPSQVTGNAADDPHVIFMEEVEFDAAAYLANQGGLNFRRVATADQAATG